MTSGEDGCRFDVGIGLPLRIGRWNLFQIVPMHYYSLERSTPVRFCATTKKPEKKTMDQAQNEACLPNFITSIVSSKCSKKSIWKRMKISFN